MRHGFTAWLSPAVVIAGCVTFATVLFSSRILNDPDTFWHIRTGEWMLDHRAILSVDPFSFTAADRHWFTQEWLSEVLLALAFRAAGLPGVIALAAGAVGLTAAVLMYHLRRFLPAALAVGMVSIALANAAPPMLARPHLLAWPCLALWCGGLAVARADRAAPRYALLPVMVVWVNLHGSFMLGLLLPGVLMIEAMFDPMANRRRVLTSWGGFIVAAWAAALLNPALFEAVLFPFKLLHMTSLAAIEEWKPTDFGKSQPLEVTILLALAAGFSGKVRLPPIRLLLFLALVHGALVHARHGQLLGIVGALILAEPLGQCVDAGGLALPAVAQRRLAAGATLIALAALVVRMVLPLAPERTGASFAATLDRVPVALRVRPVLNEYGLGGPLIFNGVRPFIDGRADLYGDAFVGRYLKIVSPNRVELERALAEYGIAWTVFASDDLIVQFLDQEPGWRRLVDENGIVIHARDDPRTP